jgi:hypothetical protein
MSHRKRSGYSSARKKKKLHLFIQAGRLRAGLPSHAVVSRQKEKIAETVLLLYCVADFFGGWIVSSESAASCLASTAAVGSASVSLVGMLSSFASGAPMDAGSAFFSLVSAPVTGLETYCTLRSDVSEILLSSLTNDSPHQALFCVSIRYYWGTKELMLT